MHIAFLTPEFVTERKFDGGLANHLNRVAGGLRRMGHEPEIFVSTDRNEDLVFDGLPVHRARKFSPRAEILLKILRRTGAGWPLWFDALCTARVLAGRLRQIHRERPFDLVQGANYLAAGLRVPLRAGFPLVQRISYYLPLLNQAYERPPSLNRQAAEALEARSLRRAHFVFAPSSRLAKEVSEDLDLRVEVIPPPAYLEIEEAEEDPSTYNAALKGKRYVLFFGRICRPKGAYVLVEALARLFREERDLLGVFIGREDPRGIVEELRGRLGNEGDRLVYLGSLPHARLYPIIRRAAVVALPSRIDNFPNTCIEAMCLGRIVVGTRRTGFEDLVTDGTDGFLVEPDDAAMLEAVLQKVLELPPGEADRLQQAAREKARQFEPQKTLGKLVEYYDRCRAQHRQRNA